MAKKRKHPPVSIHKTLQGQLEVNWQDEYKNEYYCPSCEEGKFTTFYYCKRSTCQLILCCASCKKRTFLTCPVPRYIFNYLPNIECPNPLCTKIGFNGQKGWIFQKENKTNVCQCHFCKIQFYPYSIRHNSWTGIQTENKLLPFSFDDDIWDLRHFYDRPSRKSLNFQEINSQWYQIEVKHYVHYLLNSRKFENVKSVKTRLGVLKQFGDIIVQQELEDKSDINRDTVIELLDSCKNNANTTINQKLSILKKFFEWLGLEDIHLIRSRDFLKERKNDADWLDEITRKAIESHLDKIPASIKRHYLVQEYTAARPGDVCQLVFNCLIEENDKWYVKFFQRKTKRWHKIPASRKIRKIIEEQQQWIRETFDEDYPYLFCHFRTIKVASYPSFPNIKPLPEPPKADTNQNPMVRIILMLVEKENILDANGQKPHFTGKITRSSRLQEIRTKYGMEAARLYADHQHSKTTFQHYASPTREQVAEVDLPFQKLLMNSDNKFLPWQSLPESLLKNPKAHELDPEISPDSIPPRYLIYGHCALDSKIPCPFDHHHMCYGCPNFRPSTSKLPLYERQYQGEKQRLEEAEKVGAELAFEEAKETIEEMDKWLPELRRLANG